MSSWPAETKYISKSTPRIDAPAKVTGRARYSSDIQAGRLALRDDSPLEMADGKNFVGQSGQGAANSRHQGRHRCARRFVQRPVLWRGNCRRRRHEQTGVPRRFARHRSAGGTAPRICRERRRRAKAGFAARLGRLIQRCVKSAPSRKRQRGHRVSRMRGRHRRFLHDTGAASSSDRDCRHHGLVDGRWPHFLGVHTGNFQRARRSGGFHATRSQPGARHHRIHGRRLRRKIRRGGGRCFGGETFERSESAGAPHAHAF